MKKETKKEDSPWAAMDRLIKTETGHPGNGWFTLLEFAEHYEYTRPGAQHAVNKLVGQGKLEHTKRRITSCNGTRIMSFYKPKG